MEHSSPFRDVRRKANRSGRAWMLILLWAMASLIAHGAPLPQASDEPPAGADPTSVTLWHRAGDGTWTSRADFGSIQGALDAAAAGDTVLIPPGRYYETLKLHRDIIVRSLDVLDSTTVHTTILDASFAPPQNGLPVLDLDSSLTASSRIAGLTLTGGNGGAILGHGAATLIDHNAITGNTSVDHAVFGFGAKREYAGALNDCDGIVRGNAISGNSANMGGALYHCDGLVENNFFVDNEAVDFYTFIGLAPISLPGVSSTLLDCNATFRNNTIYVHDLKHEVVVNCPGGFINSIVAFAADAEAPATTPNYYQGVTPRFCSLDGWTGGGNGNTTGAPQFVDAAHGDYHIIPGSLCVDAGQTTAGLSVDLDGDQRAFIGISALRGDGSHIDIGADEYTPLSVRVAAPRTTGKFNIGQMLTIYWHGFPASVGGGDVLLELWQNGAKQGNYATVTPGKDPESLTLKIPNYLKPGDICSIRAVSLSDPTKAASTQEFTLTTAPVITAAKPQAWMRYW